MVTVGFVPARGGSKGLPGKNLVDVGGIPLVGRAVGAARGAGIAQVIVSSDSQQILAVGARFGALPVQRPAELAADHTPTLEVLVDFLTGRRDVDTLVLLQPTSPLRTAGDVYRCVAALEGSTAPSAVTVTLAAHPAEWLMKMDDTRGITPALGWDAMVPRRQDAAATYSLNGAVYAVRADHIRDGGALLEDGTVGVLMPRERSADIDDEMDLIAARALWGRLDSSTRAWSVLGAGGHARSVVDVLGRRGGTVQTVGDRDSGGQAFGVAIQNEADALATAAKDGSPVALAIGDNHVRWTVYERALQTDVELPPIVASTATASQSAALGLGTVLLEHSHVGPGAIVGPAVVVNTGAVVEHDCVIGGGAQLAPGAVVAGAGRIGARSMVGTGAVINPGVVVGDDVVVGSGAVVINDVKDKTTVVGVPAKNRSRPA